LRHVGCSWTLCCSLQWAVTSSWIDKQMGLWD
jgi:hypothetical protein